MKKLFLFGASILLITGCQSSHVAQGNDYGYSYDLSLPTVSGTQEQLTAALNAPPPDYALAGQPQSHGPASQSVVFYEGAQPSTGVVAAGTPVWTSPVAPTPAPGYVPGTPGAPIVNEPAGAGVAAGAAVGGTPVIGGAVSPGFVGTDGSVFIGGTNATPQGGINISNSNVIFPTNGVTNINNTNRFTTNTSVITNANGGVLTSNVVTSNFVAQPTTNGSGFATTPFTGGATNATPTTGPTAGVPPGTSLINQRPFGQAPTPVQSQVATGQLPTQPGPTTTEAAGAAAPGTTPQQSAPQNTTLGPNNVQTSVQASTPGTVNSANTTTTPSGSTAPVAAPRAPIAPRQLQHSQPAPAAPAAPK